MLMTQNYRICLLFFTALALSGCRPFYTASTRMNLDKADSISTALLPFFDLQEQRHEYTELEQLCDLLAEEDLSAIDKRKVNLYRIQSTLNCAIGKPMDQSTVKMLDRCMRSRSRNIVQLAQGTVLLQIADTAACNNKCAPASLIRHHAENNL